MVDVVQGEKARKKGIIITSMTNMTTMNPLQSACDSANWLLGYQDQYDHHDQMTIMTNTTTITITVYKIFKIK